MASMADHELRRAVVHGSMAHVDQALSRPGVDVYGTNAFGETALHLVSARKDIGTIRPIIKKLVDRGVSINRVALTGTPLFVAVRWHRLKAALVLLDCGADPSVEYVDDQRMNVLHRCVGTEPLAWNGDRAFNLEEWTKDHRELVRRVAARGVHLEAQSFCPMTWMDGTPLFFAAAISQDPVCVRILLEVGANPSAPVTARQLAPQDLRMTILTGLLRTFFPGEGPEAGNSPRAESFPWNDGRNDQRVLMIVMLLNSGATLGPIADVPPSRSSSALAFACERAPFDDYAILELLLKKAKAANVTLQYLQEMLREYGELPLGGGLNEIGDRLVAFIARVYPGQA